MYFDGAGRLSIVAKRSILCVCDNNFGDKMFIQEDGH